MRTRDIRATRRRCVTPVTRRACSRRCLSIELRQRVLRQVQRGRTDGRGATSPAFGAPLSLKLQQMDRWVLPPEECAGGRIMDGEICVGGADGGPCFGDSGGPGPRRIGGAWFLVSGVSRVGVDWQTGTYRGVQVIYTDLTFHRSWIRSVVRTGVA